MMFVRFKSCCRIWTTLSFKTRILSIFYTWDSFSQFLEGIVKHNITLDVNVVWFNTKSTKSILDFYLQMDLTKAILWYFVASPSILFLKLLILIDWLSLGCISIIELGRLWKFYVLCRLAYLKMNILCFKRLVVPLSCQHPPPHFSNTQFLPIACTKKMKKKNKKK